MAGLVLRKIIVRFALWRAGAHTRRSAWWNDVAQAWLQGETIEAVRTSRERWQL